MNDSKAANSIISGIGGGLFAPDAPITRQDLAVILFSLPAP
ncbi:MAG: S-layer homology domain-containing protein [Syntrophomonadaceae bacterium]|nr:S-layer homology domain-containing protein [Syntrophomonadaceae bacterium]